MAALWRLGVLLGVLGLVLLPGPGLGGLGGAVEGEGGEDALQRYLENAESAGIIDKQQLEKMRQLALSMHLSTVTTTPPPQHANDPEGQEPQDRRTSLFMRVYNQLTLLNVLYLSGAVIVMGSYSLFMTLAVERCHYAGLSVVMLVQVVFLSLAGLSLWESEEYAYAGGMYVRPHYYV